ncbi:hypothetical protein BLNAU_282 [Blattamonas nauphoetae]|uniref:PUL domain-containing protein n=1 Tax=Blattamonas nauphoetae TaxID=2049346 RepID=A0ABQ9YMK1_9EUKA|nr:hypothetical protein BLNAU_282 [Blattamonas nauphoetae]
MGRAMSQSTVSARLYELYPTYTPQQGGIVPFSPQFKRNLVTIAVGSSEYYFFNGIIQNNVGECQLGRFLQAIYLGDTHTDQATFHQWIQSIQAEAAASIDDPDTAVGSKFASEITTFLIGQPLSADIIRPSHQQVQQQPNHHSEMTSFNPSLSGQAQITFNATGQPQFPQFGATHSLSMSQYQTPQFSFSQPSLYIYETADLDQLISRFMRNAELLEKAMTDQNKAYISRPSKDPSQPQFVRNPMLLSSSEKESMKSKDTHNLLSRILQDKENRNLYHVPEQLINLLQRLRITWPLDFILPVIDVLRIISLNKLGCERLCVPRFAPPDQTGTAKPNRLSILGLMDNYVIEVMDKLINPADGQVSKTVASVIVMTMRICVNMCGSEMGVAFLTNPEYLLSFLDVGCWMIRQSQAPSIQQVGACFLHNIAIVMDQRRSSIPQLYQNCTVELARSIIYQAQVANTPAEVSPAMNNSLSYSAFTLAPGNNVDSVLIALLLALGIILYNNEPAQQSIRSLPEQESLAPALRHIVEQSFFTQSAKELANQLLQVF